MLMVAERMVQIQERISRACQRSGRPSDAVRIVAVTKTLAAPVINEAIEAGLLAIGENRVQEYLGKRIALHPHEFHLIGHLQRNKVKAILPYCHWIHSIDSFALCEEIQKQARAQDRAVQVLIEVNVSGESSKSGVRPGDASALARLAAGLPMLRVRGLMTVAEYADDPEHARGSFRLLRETLDAVRAVLPNGECDQLSMGMTNDFEVAVEEGATMVRLGTAIFGQRSGHQQTDTA